MFRRKVIGLPLVSLADGERAGYVKELILDSSGTNVVALQVEVNGHEGRVLALEDIHAIGDGAVTFSGDRALLVPLSQGKAHARPLVGRRLLTEAGSELGVVDDFWFDPESGQLTRYEVSGGVLQDVLKGRTTVPSLASVPPTGDILLPTSQGGEER